MSGQTSYTYQTPKGVAGALVDMSPKSIDSRVNSETEVDKMRFGMGVVVGGNPGTDVRVPVSTSVALDFEGVLLTGYTQQQTINGDIHVNPAQTVGVLRWGRAWARVVDGVTPQYNDPLYLVITGADAGLFTNDSDDDANLAINGRFYGGLGNGNIAPVEIHNQLP
jgi:hypothetical protein